MAIWKEYKIEEIADVVGGGTPSTKVPHFYGGNIPWLTPKDLTNYTNRYIAKGERNITIEGLSNSSSRMVPKNTILLTSRAPIGYMAIAANEVCTNQGFKSIVVNPEKADYNFVYYLLKAKMEYIKSYGTGTTFAEISASVVKNLKFNIPDLPTQTAIAEILSSLDDKIELNNKINQELENLAQTLFKQWFIDFEFPNEKGKPYKSSGGEMVEGDLGEIPAGWNIESINKLFDFLEGPGLRNWQYKDEGMPFINIRLIQNGDILVKNSSFISIEEFNTKYNHFALKIGDMVVSTSGTLGKSAIVRKSHLPLMLNTSVIRFRPKADNLRCFMYQYLQSNDFLTDLETQASGSVQLNFGPMHLNRMRIISPQQNLLDAYESVVGHLYDTILINREENQQLTNLRDTLLPKLISGELEVSQIQTTA